MQLGKAAELSAFANQDRAFLDTGSIHKEGGGNSLFGILSSLTALSFSASDVVGKAFQNVPVSSSFKTSSGANPLDNSLTCSLQLLSVSWLTSPSSPAIFSRAILCLCFHFASQPSVPLNVSPSCSSIKRASSLRSGPSTGILAPLVFTCHSQRSFTFSNFSLLFLL